MHVDMRGGYDSPWWRWIQSQVRGCVILVMDDHLLMIEDYAYVGTDFRRDPNLALQVDDHWGDIG